jgi:sphingomyelin phosphodiesterase 2
MKQKLRIVTYNAGLIQVKALSKVLFEFAPFVDLRAKALPKLLLSLNADIICLQEVFDIKHWEKIQRDTKYVFPFSAYPRSRRPALFNLGVAFLSRIPLDETIFTRFSDQLIEEFMLAPKGAGFVKVRPAKYFDIWIANSHTTAGGSKHHPESKITDQCRAKQLTELSTKIDSLSGSQCGKMIFGDLNCGPEASCENYQLLIDLGYSDSVKSVFDSKGLVAPPTWDPTNTLNVQSPHKTSPKQRIDHALVGRAWTNRLSVENVSIIGMEPTIELSDGKTCTVSDHYGWVVDYVIDA